MEDIQKHYKNIIALKKKSFDLWVLTYKHEKSISFFFFFFFLQNYICYTEKNT